MSDLPCFRGTGVMHILVSRHLIGIFWAIVRHFACLNAKAETQRERGRRLSLRGPVEDMKSYALSSFT